MKAPKLKRILFDDGALSNGFLTRDRTLVIEGTAVAKSKVTIFDNGVKIGTVKADKKGNWSFSTAGLADGAHAFTASAKLKKDKSKQSKEMGGTVDATAPGQPGIDLSATSDTGSSGTDNITGDTTPTLTGTADAGSTVTIRDGATVLGTTVANGSGQWSFAAGALGDGAHTLSATATDTAGNTSAASSVLVVTIDASAPAAPSAPDLVAGSDSGELGSDNLTNDATPTFAGIAEAGSTVTIRDGATVLGTTVANGSGQWSFTSPTLSHGAHSIAATATDTAGNASAASSALVVRIDIIGPTATIVVADPSLKVGETSLVTITFSEAVTGLATDDLTVENGGLGGLSTSDGGITWTATLTPTASVTDASNVITLANYGIADIAGNAGTGSTTSNTYAIDTAPPPAPSTPDLADDSDTGGSSTDNQTGDTTPTFTGTAEAGSTVRLFADGVEVGNAVATGGNWSITTTVLASGDYDITAIATDPAGNTSASSPALTVTIDDPAPPAPVITGFDDDTGDPDDHVTLDDTLVISGTADPDATISVHDGSTLLGTTTANESGAWSFTTDALEEGAHVFTATATDAGSNTSPPSQPLSVRIGLDLDVASLTAAWGFRIFGADAGDAAAQSVSSAGDINGDGYDDLIVGAHIAKGPENDHDGAGEAIIVFGKAAGFADLDAAALAPADGFRIFGGMVEGDSDWLGFSVSSAGDINGDGYDDLIIGAPQADSSGGAAVVIFGKSSGFADIDLSETPAPADGFRIFADFNDFAGWSASSAGDVNGDGYDDLVVGVPSGDGSTNGRPDAGEAAVIFGKAGGFADLNVSTMAPSDGYRIFGANGFLSSNTGDSAGRAVSSAGDINGDGFDDLIIGAPYADGPSNTKVSAGEAIIVFGKAGGAGGGFANIDVNASDFVTSGTGFRIFGSEADDRAGFSVSSAGDINGDGFDDLILGAVSADGPANDRSLAGEAVIVFGKASGFTNTDVSSGTFVSSGAGFRIFGALASDRAGWSVSSAGDVNGDGFGDLIIGAPDGDGPGDARADAGEAIIIFGKAAGFGNIDLADPLAPGAGFRVFGALAFDELGYSVSPAGDVNGDGFDDLIIGADQGDGPADDRPLSGEAIVVFGGDLLGSVVNVGTAGDDTLTGTAAAETFVGGRGNDTMTGVGGADTFHGGAGADAITVADLAFRTVDGGSGVDTLRLDEAGAAIDLTGVAGHRITGIEKLDLAGNADNALVLDRQSVAAMTDAIGGAFPASTLLVKGDAGDALTLLNGWSRGATVTDPHGETGDYVTWAYGAVTVLVESDITVDRAVSALDAATLTGDAGFRIFGGATGDAAGWSVSSAGDVNGDGFDDMIIGARNAGPGEAIVVFGKPGGFGDVDLAAFTAGTDGFRVIGANASDLAGVSVSSAGDINGDGFDDLIVGARGGDGPGNDRSNAGETIVVFGKADGFTNINAATMTVGTDGFRVFGAAGADYAGYSVSSAGDVNGDGFDDLVIGAYRSHNGVTYDAGEAIVVFGKAGGFADIDVSTMVVGTDGFRIRGGRAYDLTGSSVSSAGDVNGDGFDDLIVGAPAADGVGDIRNGAGDAIVIFGKAGGFTNIDLSAPLPTQDGFVIFGANTFDNLGRSVSSAGDINGDGYADLIIGADFADGPANDKASAGEAIIVFGKGGSFTNIDVAANDFVSSGTGFRIFGGDVSDRLGVAVSSAGDVNGDGFDDLIVGAYYGDGPANGRSSGGEATVIFGKAGGFANIDLSATLAPTAGFRVFGADGNDRAGAAVSSAGDIDGDGFDDLIIGAREGDGPAGTRSNAGEAIVIFGGDFTGGVVYAGTNGNDTLTGTSAAETFVGGQGNDTLTGGGGADSFRGGAGDDVINIADTSFAGVDGGAGNDTLALQSGLALDFSTILPARVGSIEVFDLGGAGNSSLSLSARDLFDLSDDRDGGFTRLIVRGDAGDSVSTLDGGWTNAGLTMIGADTFTIFEKGQARLLVDTDINAAGILI